MPRTWMTSSADNAGLSEGLSGRELSTWLMWEWIVVNLFDVARDTSPERLVRVAERYGDRICVVVSHLLMFGVVTVRCLVVLRVTER